jgi:flagellar basal-body rod modification protein FlgD
VTELRYQNPFSPMDNREFVTQLAQFSLLEQLEALNRKVEEITAQLAAIRALLTGGAEAGGSGK